MFDPGFFFLSKKFAVGSGGAVDIICPEILITPPHTPTLGRGERALVIL